MAQLKDGSVIKKAGGDELIATEPQLHTHANKEVLDDLSDTDGVLNYKGSQLAGGSLINIKNGQELKLWQGTQAEYNALTPQADTLYFVEG